MFLDVDGTFTTDKTDMDTEKVKKQVIESLHAIHAKTHVDQSGKISWRGSYFPYDVMKLVPWGLIQRIFWLMRGSISIQINSTGGMDLQYHVSLLPYRILLIIVNVITFYYCLSKNEMLNKILLIIVLEWLFLYGAAYLSAKLGMNSFISEQMSRFNRPEKEIIN